MSFSVEGLWHDSPMGYHMPWSGQKLLQNVWEDAGKRKRIFDYCPEIKMIMEMKLERERCDEPQEEKKDEESMASIKAKLDEQIEEQNKQEKAGKDGR